MKIIRSVTTMAAMARRLERQGKRMGLVPTMGALHEGHCSLIRAAAAENDVVIVSIFVNPLQFGPHEGFACYPRTLPRDVQLARTAGADIVFAPSAEELYPAGHQTLVDVIHLSQRWEGRSRPGHFRGVTTIVALLFQLTRPTKAYVGQKDYQQVLIIKRLARDLRVPIRVQMLPIVREPDGLAMSSRNVLLTPRQRRQAPVLLKSLSAVRALIRRGERRASHVRSVMHRLIRSEPDVRVEYVAVVDAETLEPVRRLHGRVAVLLAARIGRVRLIDNLLVEVT